MPRILAVNDDPLARAAVQRVMRRLGHVTDEAPDGDAALRLVGEQRYDAVLVSFELAGPADVFAVLRRLRERQPRCLRVLLVGREAYAAVADTIGERDGYRVLAKPIRTEALEALAEEVVGDETAEATALLRECIDGDLLSLAVQPIVRADDRSLFAVECLLRSRHPVADTAMAVLDVAERAGKIAELGGVVNKLAARWAETLRTHVQLFVNVHPAQLSDASFFSRFAPLYPHARRVVFEITERSSLQDVPQWASAIKALDGAGFHLALDDLGAGYSGLSLLAELHPAYIKVDMSIVRDVHLESRKQRLVSLLANFANTTGAKLVAEGVETNDEALALRYCGAHLVQGYFYGRPTQTWPTMGIGR